MASWTPEERQTRRASTWRVAATSMLTAYGTVPCSFVVWPSLRSSPLPEIVTLSEEQANWPILAIRPWP